jgi:hypothetical protein
MELDTAAWRTKYLVGPSHGGVYKRRGVHRDRFARRVDAQSSRFAVDVARRVVRWTERHGLRPVVLVGPRRTIAAVFGALPTTSRADVALLPANLSPRTPVELGARVAPVVKRWRRDAQRNAA